MGIRTTVALVGAGALGALGLGAGPALAAPSTVTAVTHAMYHADTTSVAGACTTLSPNGPVWAYDDLSFRLSVTPEPVPDTYSVTIYANGSFSAFADPTTGACATDHGSVDGWLQMDVSSPSAPDPANVPAQVPDTVSQTQIVEMLFDNKARIGGGSQYDYTYNRIDGTKYIQKS